MYSYYSNKAVIYSEYRVITVSNHVPLISLTVVTIALRIPKHNVAYSIYATFILKIKIIIIKKPCYLLLGLYCNFIPIIRMRVG